MKKEKAEELAKTISEALKDVLNDVLINRELTFEEKKRRFGTIESYLTEKGGIIMAVSCSDGILLAGVNPDCEQTIFRIFHRIGLLGIGKDSDCQIISNQVRVPAFITGLDISKGDINAKEIAKRITHEIKRNFNYKKSKREEGPYKANFIIAELGFDIEEDLIEFINFCGGHGIVGVTRKKYWRIYETPIVTRAVVSADQIKDKDEKSQNEDSNNKNKDELRVLEIFEIPVLEELDKVFCNLYSNQNILSIREAALFAGLIIRLLDERGGRLEMVYLDRNMLKTEKRRFHHTWQRITNPNPYKPSDLWEDWKKFTAPVYRKVKKGELYPEQKNLIELFEIFKKKKFDPKEKELFKKIQREEMLKLMKDFLGKKQKDNKK